METDFDDEHVLDFRDENVRLPPWFKNENLRILFASGDWLLDGIPNTQQFDEYDIHTCFPFGEDIIAAPMNGDGPNFKSNLDYIRNKQYHSRLICILNIKDDAQMKRFNQMFEQKVVEINTLDPRVFQINCENVAIMATEVLKPNGILMMPTTCAPNMISHEFECTARKCTKKTSGGKRKRRIYRKTQRRPLKK